MIRYAEYQFWLDGVPKGQKISRRKSLEQVAKSLGRPPKEMSEAPAIPDGAEYIWHLFGDLKAAGPVSYGEMLAYQQMTGVSLSPVEVDCMRRLDEAWVRAQ